MCKAVTEMSRPNIAHNEPIGSVNVTYRPNIDKNKHMQQAIVGNAQIQDESSVVGQKKGISMKLRRLEIWAFAHGIRN